MLDCELNICILLIESLESGRTMLMFAKKVLLIRNIRSEGQLSINCGSRHWTAAGWGRSLEVPNRRGGWVLCFLLVKPCLKT